MRGKLMVAAVVGLVVAMGAVLAVLRPWRTLPRGLRLVSLSSADFADARHGYLLLGDCTDETCQAWVAVTADGGRSWSGTAVPGFTFARTRVLVDGGTQVGEGWQGILRYELHALDATRAVIDGFDSPSKRWFTADAGRSWAAVPTAPVETVAEVPAGAGAFQRSQFVLLDGRSATLATPPPLPAGVMWPGTLREMVDGSLWIQHDNRVYRSRDRGRTWAELFWPDGLPASGSQYVVEPTDGRTLYVVEPRDGRVWRSADDGRHWDSLGLAFGVSMSAWGVRTVGLSTGELVLVSPLDGPDMDRTERVIGPTDREFRPVDPGREPVGQIPVLTLVGPAPSRVAVHGTDGSMIELPFACLNPRCV